MSALPPGWLCDLLVVSHLTAASSRRPPGLGLGGLSTTKRGTFSSLAVLIYAQNLLYPPPPFFSEPTADTEHIANTDTEAHVWF
jgi:hypothetical protein